MRPTYLEDNTNQELREKWQVAAASFWAAEEIVFQLRWYQMQASELWVEKGEINEDLVDWEMERNQAGRAFESVEEENSGAKMARHPVGAGK